jgi:hypothetical protein
VSKPATANAAIQRIDSAAKWIHYSLCVNLISDLRGLRRTCWRQPIKGLNAERAKTTAGGCGGVGGGRRGRETGAGDGGGRRETSVSGPSALALLSRFFLAFPSVFCIGALLRSCPLLTFTTSIYGYFRICRYPPNEISAVLLYFVDPYNTCTSLFAVQYENARYNYCVASPNLPLFQFPAHNFNWDSRNFSRKQK